jgi:hypothetical protein
MATATPLYRDSKRAAYSSTCQCRQAGRQTAINAIWHKCNKLDDWLALALQPVRVSSQLPTHSCTDISQIMDAVSYQGLGRGKFERRVWVGHPCFAACMFRIRFPAGTFNHAHFRYFPKFTTSRGPTTTVYQLLCLCNAETLNNELAVQNIYNGWTTLIYWVFFQAVYRLEIYRCEGHHAISK